MTEGCRDSTPQEQFTVGLVTKSKEATLAEEVFAYSSQQRLRPLAACVIHAAKMLGLNVNMKLINSQQQCITGHAFKVE